MIYKPTEDAILTDEHKKALVIMTKIIPQQPNESFKTHDLENDSLDFLRRIVKRLSQELIHRS